MPIAWVLTNASGSAIERSTCVSAAKFTTASTPSIAPATASGSSIAPWTNDVLDVLQVLAPARVRELVEHDDLVAGLDALTDERGADEPGPAADEQLHRGSPVVVMSVPATGRPARNPARPSSHGGRCTASAPRSVPSTLNAGRGVGDGNASLVVGSTRQGEPVAASAAVARSNQVQRAAARGVEDARSRRSRRA